MPGGANGIAETAGIEKQLPVGVVRLSNKFNTSMQRVWRISLRSSPNALEHLEAFKSSHSFSQIFRKSSIAKYFLPEKVNQILQAGVGRRTSFFFRSSHISRFSTCRIEIA